MDTWDIWLDVLSATNSKVVCDVYTRRLHLFTMLLLAVHGHSIAYIGVIAVVTATNTPLLVVKATQVTPLVLISQTDRLKYAWIRWNN